MKSLAGALTAAAILLASNVPTTAQKSAVPSKPDDRTVLHVLNRVGFGARPGDIERVQKTGLAAYIDQQLNPDRIPDTALEARLASFTTLTMSTRELSDKYFRPALEARRDQQLRQRA